MNPESKARFARVPAVLVLLFAALALGLSPTAGRAYDAPAPVQAADPEDDEGKKSDEESQSDPEDEQEPEDKGKAADEKKQDEPGDRPKVKTRHGRPQLDPDLQKKLSDLFEEGASRRTQQDRKGQAGPDPRKGKDKPSVDRPSRTPPRRTPARPTTAAKRGGPKEKPTGETTALDIAPSLSDIPPEEKTYKFSIKDGTYEQLVEGFARQTGLGVIGEAPKDGGKVSFVTTESLSYEDAFKRMRMLLKNYKPHDPYYLLRHERHLQVIRVNDYLRDLPPERMYRTLDGFRHANLPDDELALVIYTPTSGSVAELRIVRDFMPDYVRVSPLEDRNAVTIYAFVQDIDKYFEIKSILVGGSDDPRTLERIKIHHMLPSEAMRKLQELMSFDGAPSRPRGSSTPRRAGKEPSRLETMREPVVSILADDAQGVLIVRAMQDKIEEIKLLLPYVDVDTSRLGQEPVVIPVEHAEPAELIETVQQILVAFSAPPQASRPQTTTSRRKKPAKTPAATSASAVGITMLVHPSKSAIIVIAKEEEVARVRRLIAQFDKAYVEGPLRIDLEHVAANELVSALLSVLGESGGPKGTPKRFQLVPDRAGKALWFTGSKRDLKRVRELLALLDVEKQGVTLHVVTLVRLLPSFVANMLREYEKESVVPTAVAPSKKSAPRRRPKRVSAAKFTPDDEHSRLYILCTEDQWEEYQPLIAALEAAESDDPLFVRLALEHVRPEDAIERLSAFFAAGGRETAVAYMPTDGGILVIGATDAHLEDIKVLLVEIDQPVEIEQRTFEIQHANPADIRSVIETLVGEDGKAPAPRRKLPKGAKGAAAVSAVTSPALTIVEMGKRLIVRTTPERMGKVEALIAEFDVEEMETELKVYEDFSPGADIEGIADTLVSLLAGAKPTARPPKGGAARSPTRKAPRFIPQPAVRRLLVIAMPEAFAEIEELLDVLRTESEVKPIQTEFIEVKFADPEELVEQIGPLLDMKVRELVTVGELGAALEKERAGGKGQRKQPGQSRGTGDRYHMVADARNGCIVIAAREAVIEEARKLIAQFDKPSMDEEVIFHLYELENADAAAIVKAVKEMRGAPVRPTARKGKGRGAGGSAAVAGLTITEAPGGRAVVLHGPRQDVEQAVEWIGHLDERSTRGRIIKVYGIAHADIVKLVEVIMNVVDTRPKRPGVKAPRGRKGAVKPEEEEEFSFTKTWTGEEVYAQADLIANTLLVAASPAKIAEIDLIVEQMDTEDSDVGPTPSMPKLTYELQYADDALDAAFEAEMVFEQLWPYAGEPPRVDAAFWGNSLIVAYPHEDRFDEIRELIRAHVDKIPDGWREIVRRVKKPPPGLGVKEAAQWIKMNNPELDIEVYDLSRGEIEEYNLERVTAPKKTAEANPCVLPLAFARMASDLAATLTAQQEAADPPTETEKEPRAASGSRRQEDREAQPADDLFDAAVSALMTDEGGKVRIGYSEEEGVFVIEGPANVLKDVDDWLDDMEEEVKEGIVKADIRIYRVRYIDVNTAADIIEEMFNATRQQRQMILQQQRQQQQRLRQQQQQQRRQQQQQQPGKGEQPGQQPQRPGQRGQQQQANVPQLPPTTVRVYPSERDRTLILRADTSQYPALLELLATIDQPKPIDSDMRIFQLEKLNAVEVEELLKSMLHLDERPRRTTRAGRSRAPGRPNIPSSVRGAGNQLPQTILQETATGSGVLGIDPEDITLFSNEMANTIIVMAPRVALDYIGELIKQLESEEIRERIARYYELHYAQVGEVADHLTVHFEEGGAPAKLRRVGKGAAGKSSGASLTVPSFIPYPRLNLLTVQALEEDFEEIEDIIKRLDVRDEQEWKHVILKHADAGAVVDTLTQMFTGRRVTQGRAGKRRAAPTLGETGPRFIGEEGGRMLLYSAPAGQHELIHETIARLESEAEAKSRVRIVELEHANASEVAEAIQTAYGSGRGGRRGGGRPGGTARFTVTGDDASKLLFVVADDAMFAEIEALTKSLDKPRDIGVEFKIYPLKYANARQVHAQMTRLMTDYMRRLGRDRGGIEAFSVEADDEANALIVLGGPAVFGFVEENLAKIDTPAYATGQPGVLMVPVMNADASELAQTINQLWGGRSLAPGETRPQATANRSLNVLIVRGTKKQLEEINRDILEPLKEQPPVIKQVHTYKLQKANAEEVARALQGLYRGRRPMIRGEQPVQITPDPATNSLLISANETEMAELTTLLETLDVDPDLSGMQQVKSIHLENADPYVAQEAITRLFRATGRSPRDQVAAIGDHQTQSVIVASSPANMTRIEEFLKEFDSETSTQLQVHVVNIDNADAESIARTLNEVFVRSVPRPRGGGAPPISISSVRGSKAILVKSNEEDFADIQEAVDALDSEAASGAEEVRVVTLMYGDASEMQRAMQETLQKTGGRGRELVGDVRIAALPGSNALVVSGGREKVDELQAKIKELDAAGKIGTEPQLIRLTHVNVGQILPTLQETFTDVRGRARGKMAPIITADEAQNALIVRASPSDVTAIKSLVENLDTEEGAGVTNFRIVQLAMGVNLDDLADMIEQSINEGARARSGQARGRKVPTLTVTPDKRTHALVFSGSQELFADAEGLARKMEEMGPSGGKRMKVIRLGQVPADEIERVIEQLKGESASSSKRGSTRSRSRPSSGRRSSGRSGSRRP